MAFLTERSIAAVRLSTQIEDSRLNISGRDHDAALYAEHADTMPLGETEPVARLHLAGEGMDVEAELDASQLDALADALFHIQEGCRVHADGRDDTGLDRDAQQLARSIKAYARDLEGHLDNLEAMIDGQAEGYALFARDRIRQAISELENIDAEEVAADAE